jgi:hypothetical protein
MGWTDTFNPYDQVTSTHIPHPSRCVLFGCHSATVGNVNRKPSPMTFKRCMGLYHPQLILEVYTAGSIPHEKPLRQWHNAKVPKTLPVDPPAGLQWWFLRVGEHTYSTRYRPGKSTAKDCTKELYLRRADSDNVPFLPIRKWCHALIIIVHMSIVPLPKDDTFLTHHQS